MDLEPSGEISLISRGAYVALARVLLGQQRRADALALLDRLIETAPDDVWGLEPLVVKALALQAQGDLHEAQDMISRALPAAEGQGYVRLFLDEGDAMRRLLQHVAADGGEASYANRLLAAFGAEHRVVAVPSEHGTGSLLEPLNDRELAVLRHMAAGLSNQDIANELFLAVNTVKWYARNVYGKLGVNRRSQAVARARDLRIV